jgi:hypothetical protein
MVFIGLTLLTGRVGLDPAALAMTTQAQANQTPAGQIVPEADAPPACCALRQAAEAKDSADPQ